MDSSQQRLRTRSCYLGVLRIIFYFYNFLFYSFRFFSICFRKESWGARNPKYRRTVEDAQEYCSNLLGEPIVLWPDSAMERLAFSFSSPLDSLRILWDPSNPVGSPVISKEEITGRGTSDTCLCLFDPFWSFSILFGFRGISLESLGAHRESLEILRTP